MIRSIRRWRSGFTLMELIIVMAILAILMAMASSNFASSSRRGRDSKRKSDLRNIATALEAYYNDKGAYPTGVGGVMVGCGAGDAQNCDWGGQFIDQNNTLYMVQIPEDPTSSQQYYYTSNGQRYMIYAHLENTKDEGLGVDQTGYDDAFAGANTNCSNDSTVVCTYGIASPNATP